MLTRSLLSCIMMIALLAGGSFAAGSVQAAEARELIVSAAMSLKTVLEILGRQYQERGNAARVVFNFGASGDLAAQIAAGAPADVFVSAASEEMDRLESAGFVQKGTRRNIASNALVLIVPSQAKGSIASIRDLAGPEIRRIVLGDPRTSPAGRYAEDVLRNAGILDAVRDKIVYAANVRQILDYVARGETDAGIVYHTDALARAQDVSIAATAPPGSHRAVMYPAAVVNGAKNEAAAREFITMLLSRPSADVFRTYGFSAPDGN
jgi:molybdate transport system substrate-binding protein